MRSLSPISFGWVLVVLALGNAYCGGLSRGDAGSGQGGSATGASGQDGISGSHGGAAASGAQSETLGLCFGACRARVGWINA